MVEVGCVFLCAGRSRRMFGGNKLLTEFDGEVGSRKSTVIEVSAGEVLRADFKNLVGVTGFASGLIEKKLRQAGFAREAIVFNSAYEIGMHSSIRVGLNQLSADLDFFAVTLADQPLLRSQDYDFLIGQARAFPNAKIISPMYHGKRGTPTLISMQLRDEILRHPDGDQGCSYLFTTYPTEVIYVDMPATAIDIDVDTVELMNAAKKLSAEIASKEVHRGNDSGLE